MKKYTLLLLALLTLMGTGIAQNSNAIFFSENGERFYVILNGLRQNDSPETNVKVSGLNPTAYQVKIIFEDEQLGAFDKKIFLYDFTESTFRIKRKSESGTSKSTKKFANRVAKNFQEKEEKTEVFSDKADWWALNLVSEVPLPRPTTTTAAPPPTPAPQPSRRVNPQQFSSQSSTTTTTTTTSTATGQPGSENVNINVTVDAEGQTSGSVGINTNATVVEQTSVSTTSTTTTTGPGTTVVVTEDHYIMPGYDGRIGCNWPMSDADFAAAKNSIAAKSFEDTKLTIAKQVISSNCLFSHQVRDIMGLFDFEDSKLDFAKYAYGYTFDLNNYYKVNDAFDFESSVDELNAYIGTR